MLFIAMPLFQMRSTSSFHRPPDDAAGRLHHRAEVNAWAMMTSERRPHTCQEYAWSGRRASPRHWFYGARLPSAGHFLLARRGSPAAVTH